MIVLFTISYCPISVEYLIWFHKTTLWALSSHFQPAVAGSVTDLFGCSDGQDGILVYLVARKLRPAWDSVDEFIKLLIHPPHQSLQSPHTLSHTHSQKSTLAHTHKQKNTTHEHYTRTHTFFHTHSHNTSHLIPQPTPPHTPVLILHITLFVFTVPRIHSMHLIHASYSI